MLRIVHDAASPAIRPLDLEELCRLAARDAGAGPGGGAARSTAGVQLPDARFRAREILPEPKSAGPLGLTSVW
jgi:hypothetical protein